MPATPANSLVLVTGASGFLAAHVCQQLLQRGYSVRGTVRSSAKGDYLKKLFEKDGLTNFEYVVVEDMEKDGAYDEAVKGCDAIAHTSSPFHFKVEDPHKDLINPARFGTLNLLQSAAKEPKIQRVVITSSFASIVTPKDPVYTFTEDDWNDYSPKLVEEQGKDTEGSQVYRASKVIAEKAAWEFCEKEKPGFDIATVNPPLILGPIIHECKSPESLNTSIAAFYAYLTGDKSDEDATKPAGMMVDVRDVAKIHIDALATPEAGGKRFCVSSESYHWQPLLDIMHDDKQADLRKQFPKLIRGKPGCPAPVQNQIDSSRAKELFGWKPIPTEKVVVDMAKSLAERQKEWK